MHRALFTAHLIALLAFGCDSSPETRPDGAADAAADAAKDATPDAADSAADSPPADGATPPDTRSGDVINPSSPLHALKAGQWYEVQNSKLADVAPTGWSGSVINAWNGGAFDSKRNRLVVWGGGHNDYSGNEIYAFDVDDLKWLRLTDPASPYCRTSRGSGDSGCIGVVNPDGTPISRHSYGGLEYLAHLDALYARSGAPDSAQGGCGARGVWLYLFASKRWVLYDDDAGDSPYRGCEEKAVYDPVSKTIFHRSNGFFSYAFGANCQLGNADFGADPSGKTACAGSWQRVAPSPHQLNAAWDTSGRSLAYADGKVYEVGNNDSPPANSNGTGKRTLVFDINNGWAKTIADNKGDTACTGAGNPGLAYHAPTKRLVCWRGGAMVYTMKLDGTFTWVGHDTSGGAVTPPAVTASGGVYGRFRYVPAYDVFVTVDSHTKNVFVLRAP